MIYSQIILLCPGKTFHIVEHYQYLQMIGINEYIG